MSQLPDPHGTTLNTDQMIELAMQTREQLISAAEDLSVIAKELRRRLSEREEGCTDDG